jgi:P-type Ca2+ transporter type 2C
VTPLNQTVPSPQRESSPSGPLRERAWSAAADELVGELHSDRKRGLDAGQVEKSRAEFGANQLTEAAPTPLWRKLLRQFNDVMIWLLIAAAIIAGVVGEIVDCIAILAIVILNAVISFLQEERAEQSLAALKKMSSPRARVLREGQMQDIDASDLVPGDLMLLEAGDNISADARLLEAFGLSVQESALTGESTPVDKDHAAQLDANVSLGDRQNMVFMGTVVTAGKATALVTATGMQTQLGQIAGMLGEQGREQTPLQRRLTRLGKTLAVVCLVLVGIVFLLEYRRSGKFLEVFLVSVSLAVAAIPEGLPAVVTFALALGIQRLVKRNAIIRKLPAIETLGCVTVICSDKTGTLTRNEMTVRAIVAGDSQYDVTGSGYNPRDGELQSKNGKANEDPDLQALLRVATRCNNSQVRTKADDPQAWEIVGDPTEAALIVAAKKAGFETSSDDWEPVSEIPFDSQRKAMSVIGREKHGPTSIYTKGAPEVILALCSHEQVGDERRELDDQRRKHWMGHNSRMANDALRVLGLAFRHEESGGKQPEEKELTFAGLMGMIDPPRTEAKEAIGLCHTAGIRPVMITGDHPATAKAIAQQLGLLNDKSRVLTGAELQDLSEEAFNQTIEQVSVYARVSAEHKLRIVKTWQKREQVVAMTGDGVNDAPAVKAADVGVAMGIAGTDVTKEASDMVLTDDNFRSIVGAVEQGRGIYENIQNCIRYLLSCNAGEVLFMFFATAIGWPVPLVAIQILWINLVTDGLPALALVMEPPDAENMQRAPRSPREQILDLRSGSLIIWQGILMAGATAVGFWSVYDGTEDSLGMARTVAFCILAFSQLLFSLACRSSRKTLPELGAFTNPYLLAAIAGSAVLQFAVVTIPFLQHVFKASPPSWQQWELIAAVSLAPVTIVEVTKIVLLLVRGKRC